jgi:hypothetical protein
MIASLLAPERVSAVGDVLVVGGLVVGRRRAVVRVGLLNLRWHQFRAWRVQLAGPGCAKRGMVTCVELLAEDVELDA